jgi:integrase
LSSRGARQIVEHLGRVVGVHLTWHRFRHTFLDTVYAALAHQPNGIDLLQEIAGWSAASSADPYVRRARQRSANAVLASYQEGLFPPARAAVHGEVPR